MSSLSSNAASTPMAGSSARLSPHPSARFSLTGWSATGSRSRSTCSCRSGLQAEEATRQAMDAQMLVPPLTFVVILAAVWAGTTATSGRRAAVRRRLDDHAVKVEVEDPRRLDRIQVLKQQTYSRLPILQALLSHISAA